MIPLRDVIPSRTVPVVALSLMALQTLVVLYRLWIGEPHAGVLALAAGVVYLWIFGENVEDRMGHGRFAVFYVLCGTAAALAGMAVTGRIGVHPLGAISGVVGGYVVLYPRSRIVVLVPVLVAVRLVEVPALFLLGIWFLMPLLTMGGTPLLPAAAAAGPIAAVGVQGGGFVAGALLVTLFRRRERERVEWWNDL